MIKKSFVFQTILVLCALIVGAGSAWAQETYVKWKKVNFNDLQHGDIVAIVDLTTGMAMTNDKGSDKKPGTVAVELNADKDRIIGSEENNELSEKILWIAEKDAEKFKFRVVYDGKWLQYDDSKLSVGEEKKNEFLGIENNCLKTVQMGGKTYYVGLKNSMMSKSWEVKVEKEGGGVDDNIKDTQIAFFRKVNDAQKFVSLKFSSDNYAKNLSAATVSPSITCTGAPVSDIAWSSSNTAVATVDNGVVSFVKRGTVVITASVGETENHDKASATCTVIIDDPTSEVPGSKNHPFTVAQAKELAQNGNVNVNNIIVYLEANCNYYIQGVISKVGGGIFDMFGDMEVPGMDDMDFDLDGIALPGMGDNGTCSYYISDDGTKDGHMKVIDGHGTVEIVDNALTYSSLSSSALSPGDKVIVCGPLVYTEDQSMFSGIGGTGGGDSEPQYSAKVDAGNYLQDITHVLIVNNITDMKANTTKTSEQLYSVSNLTAGTAGAPVFKSSDKEVANWVKNEAGTDSTFTALKEGTSKITVKVKVTLQEDDPATNDVNEEKSYTMKRKFSVDVTSRDKDPNGLKSGKYVLVTDLSQLEDGNKLLIVGMDGDTPDVMKSEDSMMGGKGADATDFLEVDEENVIVTVPDGALEVTLEKTDETYWRFRASNNEYLYASDKDAEGSEGGFDIASMFGGGGAKLKFGTEVNQGDSLLATIAIDASGDATIKYKFEDRQKDTGDGPAETVKAKNRIKFGTKLDFNMPGGGGDSDMDFSAIFDSFSMPSFSAYDEEDNTHTLPRIYRFVPYNSYWFTVGEAKWATLVSAYDVTLPDEFKAYVVTGMEGNVITIEQVTTALKGGVPYLINAPETQGSYKMTQTTGAPTPTTNLLKISDAETEGTSESSNVYVLANKEEGVGFYRWTGGLLGTGRVYLLGDTSALSNFYGFDDETTSIELKNSKIEELKFYDLSGRRVVKPTKGIYIVNGKKVIVK